MWALGVSIAAVVPRLVGGALVLVRRDRLHLALGVAAGALVGVAAFDALPEARDLLGSSAPATVVLAAAVVLGLGAFWSLERGVFGHVHSDDPACAPDRTGHIGAAGLTTHAFIDGLAVGAAFQASERLGIVVAAAVLVHALSDGLNTVAIVLRAGHRQAVAIRWLAANALAPLAGAAVGALVALPGVALGLLLGFFAGMFLYLGGLSLLPEAHRTVRDHRVVGAAAAAGVTLALVPALLV